jgi:hypothetical protein
MNKLFRPNKVPKIYVEMIEKSSYHKITIELSGHLPPQPVGYHVRLENSVKRSPGS